MDVGDAPAPPPPAMVAATVHVPSSGDSRTSRMVYTCAGLTPKAPQEWSTLSDALPALVAYARQPDDPSLRGLQSAATLEERAARLNLPRIDPREAMEDRRSSSSRRRRGRHEGRSGTGR